MENYLKESIQVREYLEKLENICKKKITIVDTDKKVCDPLVKRIRSQLNDIVQDEEMVKSYEENRSRMKRWASLIYTGVGWVAHSVMGYLNKDTADSYMEHIKKLEENAEYSKLLEQQQLTILEKSIILQNNSIHEIKSHIQEAEKEAVLYHGSIKELMWGQHFNMLVHLTQTFKDHHKAITQEILKLLSQTINGNISRLIPVSQLKANLRDIANKLFKDSVLPIDVFRGENIYHIFKIAQWKSTLINNTIILEMKIPIVSDKEFILMKAIPLPIKLEKATSIIKIKHEYFCTNPESHHASTRYNGFFKTCELDLLKTGNTASS